MVAQLLASQNLEKHFAKQGPTVMQLLASQSLDEPFGKNDPTISFSEF